MCFIFGVFGKLFLCCNRFGVILFFVGVVVSLFDFNL